MARKVDKTIKLCVICGDKAKGINFNVLTCMSCKAFFRRNALRKKDMKCPFNDTCQIDKITRKFCSKCRLKKCFESGMKKEWILSDEEKRLIKEKIMQNKIRKQQLELERKQQKDNNNNSVDHHYVSMNKKTMTTTQQQQQMNISIDNCQQLNNQKNSNKFNHYPGHNNDNNGGGGDVSTIFNQIVNDSHHHHHHHHCNNNRNVDIYGSILESSSSSLSSSSSSSSSLSATMKYSSPISSSRESSSSSSLSPDVCRMFTEPHAYSLDTLLTADESDVFFDSCIDGNNNQNQNNIGYDNQQNHIYSSYNNEKNNFHILSSKKSQQQHQQPIMINDNHFGHNHHHQSFIYSPNSYPSLFDNINNDYGMNNSSLLSHQKNRRKSHNNNDEDYDCDQNLLTKTATAAATTIDDIDVDNLRFQSSSISSSLSDCCFLFSNSIDSIDFFDNEIVDNFSFDSMMMTNDHQTIATTVNNNNNNNNTAAAATNDNNNNINNENQQSTNNNNTIDGNDTSKLMMTTPTTVMKKIDYITKANNNMAKFNDNLDNMECSIIDNDANLSPTPPSPTTKTLILNELISDEFSTLQNIDDDGIKFSSSSSLSPETNKTKTFLSENFSKTNHNNINMDDEVDCVDGIVVDTTVKLSSTSSSSSCCNENNVEDFSQYLLHDNDPPLTFQQKQQQQQQQQQRRRQIRLQGQHLNSNTMMLSSNDYCCIESLPFNDCMTESNNNNNNNMDTMMVSINDENDNNNYNYKENINNNNNNYLRNYLTDVIDGDDEMIEKNFLYDYDPATELMPPPPPPPPAIPSSSSSKKSSMNKQLKQSQPSSSSLPLLRQISLSDDELYIPELYLIQELTSACLLLKNPYKRIQYSSLLTKNPKYPCHMPHDCGIAEFFIHRLIRMSKRLGSFANLILGDQIDLLQHNIIDMLVIRSVLLYDPDREAYCFLDDKCKVSIMVDYEIIRPCCIKYDFEQHKNFPAKFKHEWKNDNIIFDLLTAIILFTPRLNQQQNEKIKEEYSRYICLLRRYLQIKYGHGNDDAKNSFQILMSLIDEMRLLAEDINQLFVRIYRVMHSFPLFMDLKLGTTNDNDTLFNDNIISFHHHNNNKSHCNHNNQNNNDDEIMAIANVINNEHNIQLKMGNNLTIEGSNISANNNNDNNNINCSGLTGQISSSSSSSYSIMNGTKMGQNTDVDDGNQISMMFMPSNVHGNAGNHHHHHHHHHSNHPNNNNTANTYHECFLNSVN
ncbi:zinc ion binding [Dermatophagoides pteronyssinus]|uniref:Zinc ion binding n=1 Tax=Dermatophagoides pteronyssinus TaxID=6956 RepID=A0ABQ8JVJ8_DERPT|nr:zinc ion binding [Dermatophagoides pteronyssinus]